jgi:hypothetical protein
VADKFPRFPQNQRVEWLGRPGTVYLQREDSGAVYLRLDGADGDASLTCVLPGELGGLTELPPDPLARPWAP